MNLNSQRKCKEILREILFHCRSVGYSIEPTVKSGLYAIGILWGIIFPFVLWAE